MKALPYLLTKEFKQMFRNLLLPIVFILLPIAMMNVVPRIATQEVKNLNITTCIPSAPITRKPTLCSKREK